MDFLRHTLSILQGFVYPDGTSRHNPIDPDAPLPSLSVASLRPSMPEVAHCFHLPLSAMLSPARLTTDIFRGARPYSRIKVSDLVAGFGLTWENNTGVNEVGGGMDGELEVWGLTGWYLTVLMTTLHKSTPLVRSQA